MGLLIRKIRLFIVATIAFAIMAISCNKKIQWEHFTFYREINQGELRKVKTNGIYYSIIPKECIFDGRKRDGVIWFVFYENGFYVSNDRAAFASPAYSINLPDSIKDYVTRYNARKYSVKYQDDINFWGAYVIRNDSVLMQEFQSLRFFDSFTLRKAKILNDTTLEFEKGFCENVKMVCKKFTLIKTKGKLDSINLFIKRAELKKELDKLYDLRQRNGGLKKL